MAITEIREVDTRWLPAEMHKLVWTDFEDASLIQRGTILFDHSRGAMYAGEVQGGDNSHGFFRWRIRWYKSVDNFIDESITVAQAETYARKGVYYWADPCMQS